MTLQTPTPGQQALEEWPILSPQGREFVSTRTVDNNNTCRGTVIGIVKKKRLYELSRQLSLKISPAVFTGLPANSSVKAIKKLENTTSTTKMYTFIRGVNIMNAAI